MNQSLWKDFILPQNEQRGKKTIGDFQQDFKEPRKPGADSCGTYKAQCLEHN